MNSRLAVVSSSLYILRVHVSASDLKVRLNGVTKNMFISTPIYTYI